MKEEKWESMEMVREGEKKIMLKMIMRGEKGVG